jgi:hypothetical protein
VTPNTLQLIERAFGTLTAEETAKVMDLCLTHMPEADALEVVRAHYPEWFPDDEE